MLGRRTMVAAGSLLLAGVVSWQHVREGTTRGAVSETVESSGLVVRHPDLAAESARLADPVAGELLVARVFLADGLDVSWLADLPLDQASREAARVSERLHWAEATAAGAWSQRPASWQAPLIVGGVRFLEMWRRGGDELLRRREEWEAPLRVARERAPSSPEPGRLLAAAYLTVWYALADTDRAEATGLIAEAFTDRATFDRLLPAWLRAAADEEQAYSILPDRSYVWQRVARDAERSRRWSHLADARSRWRSAVERELQADIAEARQRISGGDLLGGRRLLLSVIGRCPVERRYEDELRAAMTHLPAGPIPPGSSADLAPWLEWSVELALHGAPPLGAELLRRIAGASSHLSAAERAEAALLGADLATAERLERRTDMAWSEEWAPYLVLKARLLRDRGEPAAARRTLEAVHRSWRHHPVRVELLHSLEPPGSQPTTGGRRSWQASDWSWQAGEPRLLLAPTGPADLVVEVDATPPAGGLVELFLDGDLVLVRPVAAGERLEIPLEPSDRHRLLVWHVVAGGAILPGSVRLSTQPAPA